MTCANHLGLFIMIEIVTTFNLFCIFSSLLSKLVYPAIIVLRNWISKSTVHTYTYPSKCICFRSVNFYILSIKVHTHLLINRVVLSSTHTLGSLYCVDRDVFCINKREMKMVQYLWTTNLVKYLLLVLLLLLPLTLLQSTCKTCTRSM